MPRIAVIGAGPSGLSTLMSFRQAEIEGKQVPEVVCYKNRRIGEVCGSIPGALVPISLETVCITVCTDICGRMDQRNAWNLEITLLMNILESLSRRFHLDPSCSII